MKGRYVLLALAVVLALPASAQALTFARAFNLSFNENESNCYTRNSDFYSCTLPNYQTPQCNPTGSNKAGVAQWNCISKFAQSPRFPGIPGVGTPRLCTELDPWDPYGTHVSGGWLTCVNTGGLGAPAG